MAYFGQNIAASFFFFGTFFTFYIAWNMFLAYPIILMCNFFSGMTQPPKHLHIPLLNLFLCVLLFCPHVCLCTMCVPDDLRTQTRMLHSLGLKLSTIVNCHVMWVLGLEPRFFGRAASVLHWLSP